MTVSSMSDTYKLNNGVLIPCLGFGTFKAAEGNSSEVIRTAIDAGYRHFDTATFYDTEDNLGEAIASSGIAREEFFITTKLWKADLGYDNTLKSFDESLARLKTDYVDLYLIHWPLPSPDSTDWRMKDIDTWKAMEEIYNSGRAKAIGLSNFLPHHIENILSCAEVVPAVNQLEFHPGYTQETAVRYCEEHGILVEAWSPLGRTRVLKDSLIMAVASKYNVTPAQVCLRYALQRGVVPIPKASSVERMKNNMDVFSFELSDEDMSRLSTMPQNGWSGEHPDRENVAVETPY